MATKSVKVECAKCLSCPAWIPLSDSEKVSKPVHLVSTVYCPVEKMRTTFYRYETKWWEIPEDLAARGYFYDKELHNSH